MVCYFLIWPLTCKIRKAKKRLKIRELALWISAHLCCTRGSLWKLEILPDSLPAHNLIPNCSGCVMPRCSAIYYLTPRHHLPMLCVSSLAVTGASVSFSSDGSAHIDVSAGLGLVVTEGEF